jgi:hypothetical protein
VWFQPVAARTTLLRDAKTMTQPVRNALFMRLYSLPPGRLSCPRFVTIIGRCFIGWWLSAFQEMSLLDFWFGAGVAWSGGSSYTGYFLSVLDGLTPSRGSGCCAGDSAVVFLEMGVESE